jgi:mRNA-degrading endonuclease toxin of MazEF toxin-antitoxin module
MNGTQQIWHDRRLGSESETGQRLLDHPEPAAPPELGKVRPGVIVSNSIQNERLDSVVVVPLSSRAPEIWPLRLRVEVAGMKTSFAVIPGIRQVSKTRLHELAAYASTTAMDRLGDALALYLGE